MISKRRLVTLIAVIATALMLAACGAQDEAATPQVESSPVPFVPTETPAESTQPDPDTNESNLDWVTLPAGICQDIEASVAAELGVTEIWLETNAPFEDYLGGTFGTGCLINVDGTGADFANTSDVFLQLQIMLVDIGWTPDPLYAGGGPTGELGGFRRDAGLMLVKVEWHPSADANCPDDQAISACSLTPEQQIYNITLSVAMQ